MALSLDGVKHSADAANESLPDLDFEQKTTGSTGASSCSSSTRAHLKAPDAWIRKAATDSLRQVPADSGEGDSAMLAALGQLNDQVIVVRRSAVEALKELSKDAHPSAVRQVLDQIMVWMAEPKDLEVLETLVAALTAVASPGDKEVIATLCRFSKDPCCWVRIECVKGLQALVTNGDSAILRELVTRSRDSSWQVRGAVAEALGGIPGFAGNAIALESVADLIKDMCPQVSVSAKAAHQRLSDGCALADCALTLDAGGAAPKPEVDVDLREELAEKSARAPEEAIEAERRDLPEQFTLPKMPVIAPSTAMMLCAGAALFAGMALAISRSTRVRR
eukprot:TRINITY_DN34761_c0_g1_i1.p1 TRINITY_DN34761_c0_g1~~TRINITY_DN34761_c0_g1_i1.p1  ORF type:complete len:345 (+),score=82.17 TRINITY_DN34761_c0_g1_i1:33-1037(+)